MTTVKVEDYSDIKVRSWRSGFLPRGMVYLTVQGEEIDLYPDEARELVKALKKHIKKAEGK